MVIGDIGSGHPRGGAVWVGTMAVGEWLPVSPAP